MLNEFFSQLHGIIEMLKTAAIDIFLLAVFIRHLLEAWSRRK